MFSRCVYAAQKSLVIGAAAIVVGLLVGGLLGMFAGYFRGWTDRTLSTAFDVMLSFPALILASAHRRLSGSTTGGSSA